MNKDIKVLETNPIICTFFGHCDVCDEIYEDLKQTIFDIIENKKVTEFYIGNNGNFDRLCKKAVLEAKKTYPQIKLVLILAYMQLKKRLSIKPMIQAYIQKA